MESTCSEPPGTPAPSAPSFALGYRDQGPGDAHLPWRDRDTRRIADPEDYEHVEHVDSEASVEYVTPSASPTASIDCSKPPSSSIYTSSCPEPSSQPLVIPDPRIPTDHPTPLGPRALSWQTVSIEGIPDLELDNSREEPGPHPSSPRRVSLFSSLRPPGANKPDTSRHNGHVEIPVIAQNVPPSHSSTHDHPDRVDNESRTVSASYGEGPFSSDPSQEYNSVTEDPTTIENSRHFPPRLPTARPYSSIHKRSDATRNIQSWITGHEESQVARHSPGDDEEDGSLSDDFQSFSGRSTASDDRFGSEVESLWRELKQRRLKVRDLRDSMAQKRSELRFIRPKIYEADNAFMSAIRPTLVNRGSLRQVSMEQVERRFAEVQRLRTECQDLETSYEELEDIVDREEAHLQRVEIRFFSLLGSGHDGVSVSPSVAPDNGINVDNVPHELRGISSDKPVEDLHPLFVQLTLAFASLRNEQEELSSLRNMKDQCDDTVRRTMTAGQKISKEYSDFLDDFPSREASKKEEMSHSEHQITFFRQLCEEKDVMSKHPTLEMTLTLNPRSEVEDIILGDEASILSTRKTLAHPYFSLLLSQPDHLLEEQRPLLPNEALNEAKSMPDDDPKKNHKVHQAEKESGIDNLIKGRDLKGGAGEFINHWILFGLRNSSLQVVTLFNIFRSRLGVRNLFLWQRDVLRFWDRDGTAAAMDRYHDVDRGSDYYLRVWTLARSRRASESAVPGKLAREHRRTRSSGAVTFPTV
ncbi:hypothetical protein ACO1O0_003473 [Amphichorda felina]